jgi:hypothetical protein
VSTVKDDCMSCIIHYLMVRVNTSAIKNSGSEEMSL